MTAETPVPKSGAEVSLEEGRRGEPGVGLTRADLCEMFLRSFFFQSLWSFQRMQNLGWLFSLWPVLRRLRPDPAGRASLAMEHVGYFNTHPYMADIILGMVAGLEERHAAGEAVSRADIAAAKKMMAGPLSALGESFFWATSRPLLAVFSLAAGWLVAPGVPWIGPAIFLVLYNLLHVAVKLGGLAAGYRRQKELAEFLSRFDWQGGIRSASFAGFGLCAGSLLALWFSMGAGRGISAAFLAAGAAGLWWKRPPSGILILLTVAAGVLIATAGKAP